MDSGITRVHSGPYNREIRKRACRQGVADYAGTVPNPAQPIMSPIAAISGPPDSRMPISQSVERTMSTRRGRGGGSKARTGVNDGDGHEDTRARADRAHEVGRNREQTEDGAAKRGGGRDHALELLVHATLTVARHDLRGQGQPCGETMSANRQRTICCSLSCFATSRGPEPDTSIQVLENNAQAETMNKM
jgi:hypothetical protein